MGCTSSTECETAATQVNNNNAKNDDDKTMAMSSRVPSSTTHSEMNHHCPHEENNKKIVEKRTLEEETTNSTGSTLLELGGGGCQFRIRYACLSRRGRDPEDTTKRNQDCYSVHHEFCDSSWDSFFGVYDGHGPKGEACSTFVQQRLPDLIHKKIKQQRDDDFVLTSDQIQALLHEAHTQCNNELHASKHIDDSFSGTTSITMYVQGAYGLITICNVGDSRAVLGTKITTTTTTTMQPSTTTTTTTTSTSDGGDALFLQAVPLSNDQTPHRSDEAQRCVRYGARILTFGQINATHNDDDDDSDSEDPPRIWARNGKYPGTAFTRSIGDTVAEKLGVFAEPEMLTLKISPKEKLIVLASDGVFDVMTNQQVIDMCFQYYHHAKDPAQACHAVIEHSHKEWFKNEECMDGNEEESASYDDMTIACIFICYNDDDDDDNDEIGDENENEIATLAAAAAAAAALDTTTATDTSQQQVLPPPKKPSQKQQHHKRVRQKTLRHLEDM